jgi:hypothetical protein
VTKFGASVKRRWAWWRTVGGSALPSDQWPPSE